MKRGDEESSQQGTLTDSKTKPESKEKVTLAYPLPRCDRVARQLVFGPSSRYPRQLNHEKNYQTEIQGHYTKYLTPSKGHQNWRSPDKLRTNYAQEDMATKTSHGILGPKAQEPKILFKNGGWGEKRGVSRWGTLEFVGLKRSIIIHALK